MQPIPSQILSDSVTIKNPLSVDVWENPTYQDLYQNHVHIQATNEVRKTQENTDVVLRSILFVDARISVPFIDWAALLASAERMGTDIHVTVNDTEYTVQTVDSVPNDRGKLHHYEVGLV